jgi:hypothetical protein
MACRRIGLSVYGRGSTTHVGEPHSAFTHCERCPVHVSFRPNHVLAAAPSSARPITKRATLSDVASLPVIDPKHSID